MNRQAAKPSPSTTAVSAHTDETTHDAPAAQSASPLRRSVAPSLRRFPPDFHPKQTPDANTQSESQSSPSVPADPDPTTPQTAASPPHSHKTPRSHASAPIPPVPPAPS